jgi:hypothetical protein
VRVVGHRVDEFPQLRVARALHGAGERQGDAKVEGVAGFDDRVQRLHAVDVVKGRS